MKKLFVVIFMVVFLVQISNAAVLGADLEKSIKENPAKVFHVIATFREKLNPQNVVENFNIRGDRESQVKQVVQIYKDKMHQKAFWFTQNNKIKDLVSHELSNSISFKALGYIILELTNLKEIEKIELYKKELTKPDNFFLTPSYYQFKAAKIRYTENGESRELNYELKREDVNIDPDKIINILKKIFDFIEENQPVVDTSVDTACAIPEGITNWQQLAGWQPKTSGQYEIVYENGFGMNVVEIKFRIHFYHHGSYNNVGHYITSATASIDHLNVLWGYTLNAKASIPDSGIVNVGTSSDPVAGMKIFINWQVKTIVQQQQGTVSYFIDGNGNINQVG